MPGTLHDMSWPSRNWKNTTPMPSAETKDSTTDNIR